jgi:hypothetical protein
MFGDSERNLWFIDWDSLRETKEFRASLPGGVGKATHTETQPPLATLSCPFDLRGYLRSTGTKKVAFGQI